MLTTPLIISLICSKQARYQPSHPSHQTWPLISTTQPPISTAQPPISTAQPPISTAQPPISQLSHPSLASFPGTIIFWAKLLKNFRSICTSSDFCLADSLILQEDGIEFFKFHNDDTICNRQKCTFVDLRPWQHLTVLEEKYQAQGSPKESFCLLYWEKFSQIFCDHRFSRFCRYIVLTPPTNLFTPSILKLVKLYTSWNHCSKKLTFKKCDRNLLYLKFSRLLCAHSAWEKGVAEVWGFSIFIFKLKETVS
jgi:hypothetical protein